MTGVATTARSLAETYLATDLPRRWRHTAGVAAQGNRIASVFGVDGDLLVACCWLHDVGYSPTIHDSGTGFHPLDGARFLRSRGWDRRICALIAHHSCAIKEAELRGLEHELTAEFEDEGTALRDALWYCDMTTSPDGFRVSVEDRLFEITSRYGAGTIVGEFIEIARPELLGAVARVEKIVESYG